MIMKFMSAAAGAALLMASAANAAQPAQLSDWQMDGVTAGQTLPPNVIPGGVALANAGGLSIGESSADTVTQTSTNVSTAGINPLAWIAIGQAATTSLAAGGFLFNALSVSHSDTTASLPGF